MLWKFTHLFCVLISNIFSPINQISFGISNLLSNNSTMYKSAPVKQISYSSIAKKEPLQPVKTQNNIPRPPLPRTSSINKVDPKKAAVSCKATETAISAGYRFKARNPEPDPRYPAGQFGIFWIIIIFILILLSRPAAHGWSHTR